MIAELSKHNIAVAASVVGIVGYIPYIVSTVRGKTKPHAFSWLIWTVLCAIAYVAQVSGGAGAGSIVTGVTAAACTILFLLAFVYGDRERTRFDWGCLIFALGSIPLWIAFSDPLFSVIAITIIDGVGFGPTFRKSYLRPDEETTSTFFVSGLKFLAGLLALEKWSIVTALYPLSLVVMNFVFVLMVWWRRSVLHHRAE